MSAAELPIAAIRRDGTQIRAALQEDVVAAYAEAIAIGDVFPPVTVYKDDAGTYWLSDGYHRVEANLRNKRATIRAIVRDGDRRDALLHAVGANAQHGLRRTNEDKRRAVDALLNDDEFSRWSDRKIADACRVSPELVHRVRREHLPTDGRCDTRKVERNGVVYEQRTSRIGRGRAPRRAPVAPEATPPVQAATACTDAEGGAVPEAHWSDGATSTTAMPPSVRKVLLDYLKEGIERGFDFDAQTCKYDYEDTDGAKRFEFVHWKSLHKATPDALAAWVRHQHHYIAIAEDIYAFVRPTPAEERAFFGYDDDDSDDPAPGDSFAEKVSLARANISAMAAGAATRRAELDAKEARKAARAAKRGAA